MFKGTYVDGIAVLRVRIIKGNRKLAKGILTRTRAELDWWLEVMRATEGFYLEVDYSTHKPSELNNSL